MKKLLLPEIEQQTKQKVFFLKFCSLPPDVLARFICERFWSRNHRAGSASG